jgi:uncharacterized membrane protein
MALGAASGTVAGALTDAGVSDQFMKELGETLKPGTSALCVLVRQMTTDKVLAELQGTGGKVLKSNLTKEDESKLQSALSQAQKAAIQTGTTIGAKA